MTPTRYAIYVLPGAEAPWSRFATDWLGWDVVTGAQVPHPHPNLPVADWTATPRKYGLHATVKPPFRLAEGMGETALTEACADLARSCAPVALEGLVLARLGRFIALRPVGDTAALDSLAAAWVAELDDFRAPPGEAELAKRRAGGLSPAQEANLTRWGYPYVMEEFRFHITRTGSLGPEDRARAWEVLQAELEPLLPRPCEIADLALVGEDAEGRFHLLHRFPLGN